MAYQAVRGLTLALVLCFTTLPAMAAQYAALVMDARSGKVLHSRNADTKLHPASLTKMMTLYVVFDEIKRGRLSLDQKIKVSKYAASKPPSKLGLRAGQTIELRYLIRASAVKSANDAAAAMAEAVSGSEAAFARKMTAAARAMGMSRTTFKNASGLTQSGHLSTARDMAILGRQLFFDFPEYYNLFSRRATSAKVKTVYNTNRRLLNAYEGADGIKTGYTRAAGYNLVASAKKGRKRVIVSMFGGTSSQARNRRVAELMDMGFQRMPRFQRVARPAKPNMRGTDQVRVAVAQTAPKTTPLRKSTRPEPRPTVSADVHVIATAVSRALTDRPSADAIINTRIRRTDSEGPRPMPRPATRIATKAPTTKMPDQVKTVRVTRPQGSTAWAVQIGGTHNRSEAERLLLRTALQEMEALEGSKRALEPADNPGWYHARFVGLSQSRAQAACARLAARQTPCQVMATGS